MLFWGITSCNVLLSIVVCCFFQLKIDEFESNVNEVKDPFPPDDFPGNERDVYFYMSYVLICLIIIIVLALHQHCSLGYVILCYREMTPHYY